MFHHFPHSSDGATKTILSFSTASMVKGACYDVPRREPAGRRTDWASYARIYDLMAASHPAYSQMLACLRECMEQWRINSGDLLLNLGTDTGNVSICMARAFPQGQVIHVDSNGAMNWLAAEKALEAGVLNWHCVTSRAQSMPFESGSVGAIVCIQPLHTFPSPGEMIGKMYHWLRPGGRFFACDLSALIHAREWNRHVFSASYRQEGLMRTLNLFWKSRMAARRNREMARRQQNGGAAWHALSTYRQAFEEAGFHIQPGAKSEHIYSEQITCVKI